MPTICSAANLIFFPIPKVACTSLKVLFYQINNSVEWRDTRLAYGQVHTLPGYGSLSYGATNLSDYGSFERIAVVRNPVERALSAYRDKARRVVLSGTVSETKLKSAGLPLEPNPELFFSEIEQYFECAPVIREHMRPFSYYLGENIGEINRVFRLEELDKLAEFVGQCLGKPIEMISSNSSKNSVNAPKPVSEKALQMAADFVNEDISYLSEYYQL